MSRIMIGDHFIYTEDIDSISEKTMVLKVIKEKPNPKPKPSGLMGLVYSSTIDCIEENTYHVLVIKVAAGTQTVLPDPNDKSDIVIGTYSYGTHKLYNFFTVCNDECFIDDAKLLLKEFGKHFDSSNAGRSERERRKYVADTLKDIGMTISFGSITNPDYLDTSVLYDRNIKTKQDFIDKYM